MHTISPATFRLSILASAALLTLWGCPSSTSGGGDIVSGDGTNATSGDVDPDATMDVSQTTMDQIGDACSSSKCSDDATARLECVDGRLANPTVCPLGCANNACLVDPESQGTCASPLPLAVGETATGSTAVPVLAHEWSAECTLDYGFRPAGPENVYEFTLAEDGAVRVDLTAVDATYFAIYLRTACGDETTQLRRACFGNDNPGDPVGFDYILPAGTYYLFVDDFADDGEGPGEYQVSVETTTIPTCEDHIPTIIDVSSGSATITGNTDAGSSNATWAFTNCGSSFDTTGKENVYAFTILEESTVSVAATGDIDSDFALYLRYNCADRFDQVACASTPAPESPMASFTETLPPGTYFLFVDDFANSRDEPQTYTLDILVE